MMANPRSQQRRVVLSEEEYNDNLSQVIQRQFFPDLVDLQTQVTLQQRRDAGDFAGAISVRRAARRLQEHEDLVREREALQESGGGERAEARPLHLETLTGFHERVTTEDNAEFERIQQQELAVRKAERASVLLLTNRAVRKDKDVKDKEQKCFIDGNSTPLFLASDAYTAPSIQPPIREGSAMENGLFFVPSMQDHLQVTGSSRGGGDKETKRLMPPPSLQGNSKLQLVEYTSKHRMDKRIEPSCTRFPGENRLALSQSLQRQHLEGSTTDEDGGGSTSASCTGWDDTDLDSVASSNKLRHERLQGRKRKAREMQSLVRMTPLINPNDSPIVTWGSVAATPLVVRHDPEGEMETTSATRETAMFQMPPTTSREKAAELAEARVQERALRAQSRKATSSALSSPSGLSLGLIDSSSSLRRPDSARSRSAFGSALRSAYNATATGSSSRTRTGSRHNSATPKILRPRDSKLPGGL